MKKTKCIKCKCRLYVPYKGMKVRCVHCEMERLGVDDICTTGNTEVKSYYEVNSES